MSFVNVHYMKIRVILYLQKLKIQVPNFDALSNFEKRLLLSNCDTTKFLCAILNRRRSFLYR